MTRIVSYFKRHPETLWLVGILALSTLLRLAFLHEPFDRDEGQYATIAQQVLKGGLPYRDGIEIKPPGIFYLYALAIALFGATSEAIRLFTALYATLTVLAVYAVARQTAGIRAGLCAALFYGVFSTFPLLQGSGSNTEVFLVLPLTLGYWLLLKALETKSRSYLYGLGLCAGAALLIKQVTLPVVVLELLVLLFMRSGKGRIRESALDLAACLLPAAACGLATLGYFYLRGGLSDLIYWTVEFPSRYKDSVVLGPSLAYLLMGQKSSLLVPAVFGLPPALWLARTRRDLEGVLPVLMILVVTLAITLPGKNFPHYFVMLIPFLSIPAGIGFAHLPEMKRSRMVPALAGAVLLLLFCVWDNYDYYLTYSPETVSSRKYGNTFVEAQTVAKYLREHTKPDDYLFQWGMEPEIYFLSGRRCPNPYLVSLLPGWSRDPRQARELLGRSLREKKPAYLVLQREWMDFPGETEVQAYLQSACTMEGKHGELEVYRCSQP